MTAVKDPTTHRTLTLADEAAGSEVAAQRWCSALPPYIGHKMAEIERCLLAAKCLNTLLLRDSKNLEETKVNEVLYTPLDGFMRDGLEAGLEVAIDRALTVLEALETVLPQAVRS